MSQGIQAESTPTLHPVLQGALRSLDVNLEAELKRYRRYKAGEAPLPLLYPPGSLLAQKGGHSGMTAGYKNGKSADVIAVMAGSAALQNRWRSTASSDEADNRSQVRLEVKQENGEHLAVREVEPQGSGASLVLTSYPGRAIPTTRGTQDKEVAIAQLDKEPDDYLESSAELLKSLASVAEGGVAANSENPEREGKSKLLTPLGIGSMLLLLMTGGTLWFVGTHPSVVRHLRDDNLKLVESNSKQAPKTTYPKAVDLNLDSLSTLPTSPRSSPRPVSEPVEPKPPINNPVTPPSKVQIPAVVPIPRISETDAVSRQYYYYVVTPDRGPESLEQIGKIIPDATVRDFPEGTKIQLGVFPEESSALSLVRELADRGISAQIYKTSY